MYGSKNDIVPFDDNVTSAMLSFFDMHSNTIELQIGLLPNGSKNFLSSFFGKVPFIVMQLFSLLIHFLVS